MTNIFTGINQNNQGSLAGIGNQIYFANGYNPVLVWDGVSAVAVAAGMVGPVAIMGAPSSTAGGLCTLGNHGIRYRYANMSTGYVSNPSGATTVTITAGNEALTYNIAAAATPIITSADTKCNAILIEMTLVSGGRYFQVAQVANANGSYVVSVSDANLSQAFDSDANYGSTQGQDTFSHVPPPYGTIILGYKGRCWVMGNQAFPLTGTFTNGNPNVTGLSVAFSQAWVGQVVLALNDTARYVIISGSGTAMVLAGNYQGSTGANSANIFSPTPNRGYYSRAFAPEEFMPNVWARDFLQNRSDVLTSCIGRKEAMYVFALTCSERLIYNDDPGATTSVISPIQGNRGCFNQRCLVEAEGKLYAFDRQGIWLVNEVPEHQSFNIDPALRDYVDYSQYLQFHGGYDPIDRVVIFWFVPIGGAAPTMAAMLEVDTGRWQFGLWFQAITASHLVPTSDGQVRLMIGDVNGFSWFFGVDGSFDGVPPNSRSIVTLSSVTNLQLFTTNEALPTGTYTLQGVTCYNPLTDFFSYVQSNTGNQITLGNTGLVSAPLVGQEMWLGPINVVYETKWWAGRGMEYKKSPVYLNIRLYPGTQTGQIRVYIYVDFATGPSVLTQFPTDQLPDGVTIAPNNGNYFIVSLAGGINNDGFASIPLIANYSRVIKAKVTSLRPDGVFRLAGLDIDITDKSQEKSTPGE